MKILIAEDDFATRKLMHRLLSSFGECDVAINGKECLEAFTEASNAGNPYELIALDIMMPEMDGNRVLSEIRKFEESNGIAGGDAAKIIMTTACSDSKAIMGAFKEGCEAYLVKPIEREKLIEQLRTLGVEARVEKH